MWEITSSDMETHLAFCRSMMQYGLFSFSNVDEVMKKGVPYTFDDGRDSLRWISMLIRAMHDMAARVINVVIELDRKLCLSSPIQDMDNCLTFDGTTCKKLTDTYLYSVLDLSRSMRAPMFVRTRVTRFDKYAYRALNDKLCVNFQY